MKRRPWWPPILFLACPCCCSPTTAALPVGLPARGIPGAPGGGLRPDRRPRRRDRRGRAQGQRLRLPAPVQRVLPPLRDRDAARLSRPGREGPQGDAVPPAARRAAGARRGEGPLGRRRRAGEAADRRRRGREHAELAGDGVRRFVRGLRRDDLHAVRAGRGERPEPRRAPGRQRRHRGRLLGRPALARGPLVQLLRTRFPRAQSAT